MQYVLFIFFRFVGFGVVMFGDRLSFYMDIMWIPVLCGACHGSVESCWLEYTYQLHVRLRSNWWHCIAIWCCKS